MQSLCTITDADAIFCAGISAELCFKQVQERPHRVFPSREDFVNGGVDFFPHGLILAS